MYFGRSNSILQTMTKKNVPYATAINYLYHMFKIWIFKNVFSLIIACIRIIFMKKKQTFIDSCSHKKLTNFKVVPDATKNTFICFLLIFISNFDFKANVCIIQIFFKLLICICLLNSILNAFLTYNLSFLQWWNK